jgi:transcriptional regulator with XRE-family HTH domain
MAGKKMDLGPTGGTVAGNLTRLREDAGLTYTEVSRLLAEVGRDVSPLGVRRIEDGTRRVDVDDLMALSVALNVNPNALLLPNYAGDTEAGHEVTGMPIETTGTDLWAWADGWQALPIHRADAPETDPQATGMELGRQMYARRSALEGRGFVDRVRPSGESSTARTFLAAVSKAVEDVRPGRWVSLWFHSNEEGPKASRVTAYPEGGWSDISKYFDRIKAELAGIVDSELARPFIKDISVDRESNGND